MREEALSFLREHQLGLALELLPQLHAVHIHACMQCIHTCISLVWASSSSPSSSAWAVQCRLALSSCKSCKQVGGFESSPVESSRVTSSHVQSSRIVQSSPAEPSRVQPSRVEPSRAESSRLDLT